MSDTVLEIEQPQVHTKRGPSAASIALLLCLAVVGAGTLASYLLGKPTDPDRLRWWPFVALGVSVGLVITLITVVRVHAFLALIGAAMTAGWLSRLGTLVDEEKSNHWLRAVELTTVSFGKVAGEIALIIALASVIGLCMLESGAADKIVRRFLRLFGEKRAAFALLVSTYIVSIPIFFDTIFMLLVPLAKALRLRTGKDYILYILAICCAAVVTHSMVIPHPGPTAMADALGIQPGPTIMIGWLTGIFPVAAGWIVARLINRWMDVPLVETAGTRLADLQEVMDRPEEQLPSFFASILPVVLPVVLISLASVAKALLTGRLGTMGAWVEFLGDRNIALLISTAIALWVLVRQKNLTLGQVGSMIGPPLETAGMIILITAAGGAFGLMLRNAGVGEAIKSAASGYAVNMIALSWTVALVIRVAQGSATVAMLTTAGMMAPLISAGALPYHPIYIFMAIGYGAMGISWMNDSGFWVVGKLSGLTEKQTLKSWTILLTVLSVSGLITTLLLARLLPFASK